MMIKSMTGYGGASGHAESQELSVELKSVNNRYLDVSVRLPRTYLFAEEAIKAAVGGHISRGKADVFISVSSAAGDDTQVCVNEALAGRYVSALNALALAQGLRGDFSAVDVAKLPDVLTTEKVEADKNLVAEAILSLLGEALVNFDAMRAKEGEKLAADVEARLDSVEGHIAFVEERSPQTVSEYREKLYQRMREILEDKNIDEGRILAEAAIFADRSAVAEETVRLRSHISQLREMIRGSSPAGRKLDFLIQEMNREANTIGSKCSDLDITRHVVDLKAEIEKIREQVQNVE